MQPALGRLRDLDHQVEQDVRAAPRDELAREQADVRERRRLDALDGDALAGERRPAVVALVVRRRRLAELDDVARLVDRVDEVADLPVRVAERQLYLMDRAGTGRRPPIDLLGRMSP